MLKAVRFDEQEHKALIEYIENYRDKKNKPNHSEAIRLLMEKGLEALTKPQPIENVQSAFDKDAFKNEIMAELFKSMGVPQHMFTQQPTQTPVFTQVNPQPVKQEAPKKAPTPAPKGSSSLMANLLNNSNK